MNKKIKTLKDAKRIIEEMENGDTVSFKNFFSGYGLGIYHITKINNIIYNYNSGKNWADQKADETNYESLYKNRKYFNKEEDTTPKNDEDFYNFILKIKK